jgi:Icc-related predicted phosphoesterase
MRILPISDVHVEFHEDDGTAFLSTLPTRGVDVLVIAGDLGDSEKFVSVLERLSAMFPTVVYVHGNHECYGSSMHKTKDDARKAAKRLSNVRFLDNDVAKVHGRRFLGTTMWFRPHAHNPIQGVRMNDWAEIQRFAQVVPQENAKALRFLNAEVSPGDIVVTHHAPVFRSVDPRWARDKLSRLFYVCDQNDLIFERGPAVWFHGHVHKSWDYPVWGTRVVCNPVGYLDSDPNLEFNPNKIVQV